MTADQLLSEDVEFWPLKVVIQKVGRSRSQIYRMMDDGSFPTNRKYRGSESVYWLSSDIRRWQADEIAGAPPTNDDELGLIG